MRTGIWALVSLLAACGGKGDDSGGFGTGGSDTLPEDTWSGEDTASADDTATGDDTGTGDDTATGDDADGDGFAGAEDCDDADPDVYPGADERCNGLDDDCDGITDDDPVDGTVWYTDADADGYGDPDEGVSACEPNPGTVEDGTDCDDTDAEIRPGADEVCDGADQDCDGEIDEDALDAGTVYADADGDGYGAPDTAATGCAGEGWSAEGDDCDDADALVSPAADEVCDGIDQDCDGEIDEDALDASLYYADLDSDGFGDVADPGVLSCEGSDGLALDATDCDDTDAAINPGGEEVCDGVDNDCDDTDDDDGSTDALLWYADDDEDGFGDPDVMAWGCDSPTGFVDDDSDCDDGDEGIHPDAEELCDGADQDCDGDIDDDAVDAGTWYADGDGDTYGDDGDVTLACDAPDGAVADGGDCDDGDDAVYPGAEELCNGVDDDCDGTEDNGAVGGDLWYADNDGDGFGDDDSAEESCEAPDGAVADGGDCDDDDGDTFPGAPEVCLDGIVNDCDGDEDDALDACSDRGELSLGDAWVKLTGEDAGDEAGQAVAGGDVTGDGWSDVLVGAEGVSADRGAVYVVSRPRAGSLADATAALTGEGAGDRAGESVAFGGDVDGDGYGDLLAGGTGVDDGGSNAGAAWLALGPVTGSWSVADADATLLGSARRERVGRAVAGAGDVDGDGADDVLIGGSGEATGGSGAGAVWLVYGPVTGAWSLTDADAKRTGEGAGDSAGRAVAGGVDLDGDGLDDMLVGAYSNDEAGSNAGSAYVLYGPISGEGALADADAVLLGGKANDKAGRAVAFAGDLNGDGGQDLVVGAYGYDPAGGSSAGGVHILIGAPSGTMSLADADAVIGGDNPKDFLGISVAAAGDVNGDGDADLVVGGSGEDGGGAEAGAAWLFFGPLGGTLAASDAEVALIGEGSADAAGWSVSGAGDTNGDGRDEIVIGAYGESGAGAAYLFGWGY